MKKWTTHNIKQLLSKNKEKEFHLKYNNNNNKYIPINTQGYLFNPCTDLSACG